MFLLLQLMITVRPFLFIEASSYTSSPHLFLAYYLPPNMIKISYDIVKEVELVIINSPDSVSYVSRSLLIIICNKTSCY